jgi:FAD/FMN-containing dehydrogenase
MCDGGLVIDLSDMRRIKVDPQARTASVQAGATWGELDAATQEHGLAVTGGRVSSTGVSGLTLGSGSGWLERVYGFTCDSLIEADVVTADGSFVRATEDENSELLWGLKGGGGNFGVVTRFEFRLHPIGPMVYGGMLAWPGFMGKEIATKYRDFMKRAPDTTVGAVAFVTAPPEPFVPEEARGKPIVAVIAMHVGPVEEGEDALRPLREMAPPALDMVGPMPYTALQQIIDGGNQPGFKNYWKADFIEELPDEAIDVVCSAAASVTSPLTAIILQPLGGAVPRVPADATPLGRRDAAYAYHMLAMWADDDDDRHIGWAREFSANMQPFGTGGVYLTYIGDEGEQRIRDAFGPEKYARLVALKDRYDPGNMFHVNQNIRPSSEAVGRAG